MVRARDDAARRRARHRPLRADTALSPSRRYGGLICGVVVLTWVWSGVVSLNVVPGAFTLPVLRVKFDDPLETWLYLAPSHGQILKLEAVERTNRWAYYGLHGFDFSFLFERRPLWDVAVIVLLVGVGIVSTTTLLPMVRRLRRHAGRIAARLRRPARRDVPAHGPRRSQQP